MSADPRALPTLVQYPTLTAPAENPVGNPSDTVPITITAEHEIVVPSPSNPVVILYAGLNTVFLYDCPSLDCTILAQLETDQVILVTQFDEIWYESIDEAYTGYILGEQLLQSPPDEANAMFVTLSPTLSETPDSLSPTPTTSATPPTVMTPVSSINTSNTGGTNTTGVVSSQNTSNTNNGVPPQNTASTNNVSTPVRQTLTNVPAFPTPTQTPSVTPTSTATLSFADLPDIPDSVLTPVIVGGSGLPNVVTVTVAADIALPTISALPTDSLPVP